MDPEDLRSDYLDSLGVGLEHFCIVVGGEPCWHAFHFAFLAYGADFIEEGGERVLAHLISFLKTNITYY